MAEASGHLRRTMRDDERLVWRAKPDPRAHVLVGLWEQTAGLVWAAALGVFALALVGTFTASILAGVAGLAIPGWLVASGLKGLAVVAVGGGLVLGLVVLVRTYVLREYAVTDERVILVSGAFGRDTSSVTLADVRDVDLSVGLVDRVFGTGRLAFRTAGGAQAGAVFEHLSDPYEALEVIEELRGAEPSSDGSPEAGDPHLEASPDGDASMRQGDPPPTLADLLGPEERLVGWIEPDPRAFHGGWALGLLFVKAFLAAPAVFLGPELLAMAGVPQAAVLRPGTLGVFLVLLLAAAVAIVHRAYDLALYGVTEERVITSGGVVGRDVSAVAIADVTDAEATRGSSIGSAGRARSA